MPRVQGIREFPEIALKAHSGGQFVGHDPEEQHSHKRTGGSPTHRQKEAQGPGLGLNTALLWLGQVGLIRDR